ncbi:MAG: hypothetical protein ACOVQN_06225, partial [Exiguobacterium sp.]
MVHDTGELAGAGAAVADVDSTAFDTFTSDAVTVTDEHADFIPEADDMSTDENADFILEAGDMSTDNEAGETPLHHDRTLRPRKPKTNPVHLWGKGFEDAFTFMTAQMTAKKGLEKFGSKGADAIVAEM